MTAPAGVLGRALGASLLSGLLLFVSDHPVHAWPLQAVAFLPWLYALTVWCPSTRRALLCGLVLGLGFNLPLGVVLEFPLFLSIGLALYLSLLWVALSALIHRVLGWSPLMGAFAAGAAAAIVEWVDFNLLPVWGTAQAFVRVWSAGRLAELAAATGVVGLVFVMVASQTLLVRLVTHPTARRRLALGALGLALVILALVAFERRAAPVAEVPVAAIGWTSEGIGRASRSPDQLIAQLIEPELAKVAAGGAALAVTPEVGLWLEPRDKQRILESLAALARQHRMVLAIGYFDVGADENRIAFFDRDGRALGEYTKTHLIPFFEGYTAGDGSITVVPLGDGVRLGGMICQDDNFVDVAASYGKLPVQLVAVPTNDWEQVKDHHFENSIFRAVENRYAVVRAASNGISAIVSPRGEVLVSRDHFAAGAGSIAATVPVYASRTLYSYLGEWVVALSALILAAGVAWQRARAQSSPVPEASPEPSHR
jgi:apolipoprotein N-acyltransferase